MYFLLNFLILHLFIIVSEFLSIFNVYYIVPQYALLWLYALTHRAYPPNNI